MARDQPHSDRDQPRFANWEQPRSGGRPSRAHAVRPARREQPPSRPIAAAGWAVVPTRTAWPDRRIGEVAARRRTLITHEELRKLGVSTSSIGRALDRGRLHRRHRGVYSLVDDRALPPLAREQAAVLACGADAYLSHHSAAAVWGIRPTRVGPIDVTVVGRQLHQRNGIRTHSVKSLERPDIRTFQGIPITSPARTLADIAHDLSDRELERAFDEAIAQGLFSMSALRATVAACSGRPGAARLRALAQADRNRTVTRSEAEELFLALIRRAGLPEPEVNVRIGRWEADFFWRHERLVVEIDGHAYHSARTARERDHRKDAELQAVNCFVLRISARRLRNEPEVVLVEIASALARRRAA